jgi:hypothetical protein
MRQVVHPPEAEQPTEEATCDVLKRIFVALRGVDVRKGEKGHGKAVQE